MSGSAEVFLQPLAGTDERPKAAISLEGLTLSATGLGGAAGIAAAQLQTLVSSGGGGTLAQLERLTITATGLTGETGSLAATLELLQISASSGGHADLALERLQTAGSGRTGAVGTSAATLQKLVSSGLGFQDGEGTAACVLLPLTLSATGLQAAAGVADVTLRGLTSAGTGATGGTGATQVSLPLLQVQAHGYPVGIGRAVLTLPALVAQGFVATERVDSGTALAINPRTRAVTTFAAFPFNSGCRYRGVLLVANSDGVFALTGDDDNGQPIDAYLQSGRTDFGSRAIKRVPMAYVGYRSGGHMELTVTTDEGEEYTYDLEPRHDDRMSPSRVKIGRGLAGRFWEWKLANVDGCAFDLNDLRLPAEETSRRIG